MLIEALVETVKEKVKTKEELISIIQMLDSISAYLKNNLENMDNKNGN